MTVISRNFFNQPTLQVARALLGQRLVREVAGQRLGGQIVETEAYLGLDDSASHAYKGRTARTAVMFGSPARTYVYLIYGLYYMLNIVTEAESIPAAVLIRALEPQEGLETMQANRRRGQTRPITDRNLTNGPGKLCQALAIDKTLNDWDLSRRQALWLEPGPSLPDAAIAAGPRIGIDYAAPKDREAPWRFWVKDNRFVSR